MTENSPNFDRFQKKVDEDWKRAARVEKDKLMADKKAHEAEIDDATNQAFLSFVSSLVAQTQMDLGLIEHPMTGRREFAPDQAKYMIDVLRAIDKKTRATQTPQEKQFFGKVLPELQMLFVQVQQAMGARERGGKAGGSGASGKADTDSKPKAGK